MGMAPRISRMHIAILTGGGDCPGLNSLVRATALALWSRGIQVSGIERGFRGLMDDQLRPLRPADVEGLEGQGGSILGTHNRADPFCDLDHAGEDRSTQVLAMARSRGLQGVVAIGGDGTVAIAERLHARGLPMLVIPKTIDNDLPGTDIAFGFDSAVAIATQALERLRTTAQAHGRVMVLETMGRRAGWIALAAGLAGAADIILIPERPFQVEAVVQQCLAREDLLGTRVTTRGPTRGTTGGPLRGGTLICVAEGAHAQGEEATVARHVTRSPDPVRLGGVAEALRVPLEAQLLGEVRTTQLGHLQRGGAATSYDRTLACLLGAAAAQEAAQGRFGNLVAWRDGRCVCVPLQDVAGHTRSVPLDHPWLQAADSLGVSFGQLEAGSAA